MSVNCKGVKAFVNAANVAAGPVWTKSDNRTNERTALDHLRQQGFLLFDDIEERFKQFIEVNRLNCFLVEVSCAMWTTSSAGVSRRCTISCGIVEQRGSIPSVD